jgi:peptidyl-prolyl cis-trans isomerase D
MLETMRKSSRSLVIYVLFGIVIAVFIINFGPQSRGGSCEQTMGNDHYAARVAGDTISTNDFRYGFMLMGGGQFPAKLARQERFKEMVMDRLIDRELLAAEADRLGFVVTDDEIEEQIADARVIGLGFSRVEPRFKKDGKFNYDSFKAFLQFGLGITPKNFVEQQKREVLAARVRDLMRAGVTVSPEEVKSEFLRKNRQINLEYMRFTGQRYQATVAPTETEIAEYAAKNDAKLREAYEQKKMIYEKAPPQRRLRQILVKVAADAKPADDKAAQAKAEALAAKLAKESSKPAKGKDALTFAELAAKSSDDTATKARGGDLGWRPRGAINLSGANEDKVWAAKPGTVVGPLKGNDGYVITKVEGAREGDLSFDKVKLELAEEKLREDQANAKAKAEAEATAAKAKQTPTTALKTMFPAASEGDDAAAAETSPTPRVEETGLFALRATREGAIIEGIGVSNPIAKAAFALTPAAPAAGPFELNGSFIVVRLKERKDPDMAELDKHRAELADEAQLAKWERVINDWTRARCIEAKSARRITVNAEVLRYEDSPEPTVYEPCVGHRLFGG